MVEAIAMLREAYARPTQYAEAAKAAGQRVVGYFCDSVPVEMIEAAGMFPLRITGYPAPSRNVLDDRLFALLPKSFWSVRQSSLEFVNHSFGRIVDGSYAVLDALVIPNTRKPLFNLYGQLLAAQAADPDLPVPHLFALDRAVARVASAKEFNATSIADFRTALEAWGGQPIEDAAVVQALARRRYAAERLNVVLGWRRSDPPRLSGTDVLAIVGSAMFMSRADHDDAIARLIDEGPGPARAGPRLFVGGSPLDNDRLYRAVESLGATIVGEDHCWGERHAAIPAGSEGDPIAALQRRWHCSAACGFRLPVTTSIEAIVAQARASGADGVLLNVFRDDETQIWDTPSQVTELQRAGFPTLHLSQQPHILEDPQSVIEEVGAFITHLSGAPV